MAKRSRNRLIKLALDGRIRGEGGTHRRKQRLRHPDPNVIYADYRARNLLLNALGFFNYAAYLQSELWISIRERVMTEAGRQCAACGERCQEVHHRNYSRETLTGISLSGLVAICCACHDHIEMHDSKQKLTLKEVNARLGDLILELRSVREERLAAAAAETWA